MADSLRSNLFMLPLNTCTAIRRTQMKVLLTRNSKWHCK